MKTVQLTPDFSKETRGTKPGKVVDIKNAPTKQPQSNMNENNKTVDLNHTTAIACEECGSEVFVEASMFRKVSKLLTGAPQDMIIPIPSFLCASCGALLKELLPEQLK